jgi:N-sulfoglucosamine sulfohydrolase
MPTTFMEPVLHLVTFGLNAQGHVEECTTRYGRLRGQCRAWLAGVFLLLAGALGAAPARPNILLVLSDDHSAPHLGCYGSPNAITPHLDALAAQGMRFTRAYTTSPQCAPSRASIFAGRSPVALGVTRFTQPPGREHPFFTDVLRQYGYWSGLDGRNHHLAGRVRELDHETAALEAAGLKYLDERFDRVKITGTSGATPDDVTRSVTASFRRAFDAIPPDRPFFLYFGFNQPHRGYKRQPEGMTLFDPAKLVLPPDFPDLPEVRADYTDYLYTVYLLDRGFGVLMSELERRRLARNTIVVFMGDNGEALLRGKGTLYERGNHVPLIVRWPGVVQPASQSDVLVSGEDLATTLLEAVGLPVPSPLTGISFLPALQGRPFEGRDYVFTERGWHGSGPITRTDSLDLSRAVTSRRYRFIFNVLPDRPYVPVDMVGADAWPALLQAHAENRLSPLHERLLFQKPRPIHELYDLQNDPYELENLAGREGMKEIEMKLRIALATWMVREADFLPMPSRDYPDENWRLKSH